MKKSIFEILFAIAFLIGIFSPLYFLGFPGGPVAIPTQENLVLSYHGSIYPNITSSNRTVVGILSCFKKERARIIEWIEFHLLVGIEKFWLLDDNSNDNVTDLLIPYIEKGIVCLFEGNTTGIIDRQRSFYAYFQEHERKFGKHFPNGWVLPIDVDEYLVPSDPTKTIPDMIDLYQAKHQEQLPDTIYFKWQLFGSNGLLDPPCQFIIDSFTRKVPDTPTLGDHSADKEGHCSPDLEFWKMKITWEEKGIPSFGKYMRKAGTCLKPGPHRCENPSLEPNSFMLEGSKNLDLYLHHYSVQSRTDYLEKIRKGKIDSLTKKRSLTDSIARDCNQVEDLTATQYSKKLQSNLETTMGKEAFALKYPCYTPSENNENNVEK